MVDSHSCVCFELMIQSTSMSAEADGISEFIVTHVHWGCFRSKWWNAALGMKFVRMKCVVC